MLLCRMVVLILLNGLQQILGFIFDPRPEGGRLALFPARPFQDSSIGQARRAPFPIRRGLMICIEALVITFKEFFVRVWHWTR